MKQHLNFAQKVAEDAITYFIGILYNAEVPPDLAYLVIPDFRDEGMESWGIALHRFTLLTYYYIKKNF